ncbi:HSP20-like chaperone, partial [Gorgonomyces haynaldii]
MDKDFKELQDFFVGTLLSDWDPFSICRIPVQVSSQQQQVLVQAHVPGYKRDELLIDVQGSRLIITGDSKTPDAFKCPKFEKRIRLGADIDPSKVTAKLEDGILSVTLGKEALLNAKRIKID